MPAGRVIRLSLEQRVDAKDKADRHLLRALAISQCAAPGDLVRVSHRSGLIGYRLDRLRRVRVVSEYRCE